MCMACVYTVPGLLLIRKFHELYLPRECWIKAYIIIASKQHSIHWSSIKKKMHITYPRRMSDTRIIAKAFPLSEMLFSNLYPVNFSTATWMRQKKNKIYDNSITLYIHLGDKQNATTINERNSWLPRDGTEKMSARYTNWLTHLYPKSRCNKP